MLEMKSDIEGISMAELVRRSVEAYVPVPRTGTCLQCGGEMSLGKTDWEFPLDLNGKEKTLVITDIPSMKCSCGEETFGLDFAESVEKLVNQIAMDTLRYGKKIPERISVEELMKEEYLGRKN